jgi:hypothetical protein
MRRESGAERLVLLAPRVGFEPTTSRLTAGCSTTELPRNNASVARVGYNKWRPTLQSVK